MAYSFQLSVASVVSEAAVYTAYLIAIMTGCWVAGLLLLGVRSGVMLVSGQGLAVGFQGTILVFLNVD